MHPAHWKILHQQAHPAQRHGCVCRAPTKPLTTATQPWAHGGEGGLGDIFWGVTWRYLGQGRGVQEAAHPSRGGSVRLCPLAPQTISPGTRQSSSASLKALLAGSGLPGKHTPAALGAGRGESHGLALAVPPRHRLPPPGDSAAERGATTHGHVSPPTAIWPSCISSSD